MVIALATIMLVWFGVQEALASAQGGPGFSIAKFMSFFVLITFAYCFVRFYDSSIPGIGYSLKGFISGGTSSSRRLHRQRLDPGSPEHNPYRSGQDRKSFPSFTEPYTLLCTLHVQLVLSVLTGIDRSDHRLRRNRRNRDRIPWTGVHPLDGIRQN